MSEQDPQHPVGIQPLSPALRAVVERMSAEVMALNDEVVRRIVDEVAVYRDSPDPRLREDLVASTLGQGRLWYQTLLTATPPPPQALTVMQSAARARVHQGVPLSILLHAFRIASGVMWGQMLNAVRDHADLTAELLFNISPYHLYHFNLVSRVVSEAYSEEQLALRTQELRRQKESLQEEVKARTAQALAEKARAEDQTARLQIAHENISLLSEIGRQITASLEPEEIMLRLYAHVDKLMPAHGFGVGLYDPGKRELDIRFAMEGGRRYPGSRLRLDDLHSAPARCLHEGLPVVIDDLESEWGRSARRPGGAALEIRAGADVDSPARPGSKSLIFVPLVVKQQVRGFICVQSVEARSYHTVHVDMLSTLASYTAVALDNAHTYAELRRTRQELAHSEYMASLGRVMAGVAHEVNTPVGNIRLSISSLQDAVTGLRTAFASHSLRRSGLEEFFARFDEAAGLIARAAQRAAELMNHLKDLSVDSSEFVRRPFAVAPVVGHIVRALADELRSRHVEVHQQIDPHIELYGDPTRFEHIIVTLISNALVHGFEGRERGLIRIEASADEHACRIRFADDGNGIPPEHLEKVFEPYYTTHFGKGRSGLGLYLVHNVVTAVFQGELAIDSRPGGGTELRMTLPYKERRG